MNDVPQRPPDKHPRHLCLLVLAARAASVSARTIFQKGFDSVLFGRVDVPDVKASFRKHAAEMTFAVKVNDWFEDSIFLLDLMCSLSSLDKKEMVKTEGQRFFCRFNCNLARKIKSPFERLATYWRIFREFDFRYSPLEFVIDGNRYLYRMRNVKGKLRRMLASGAWSIQ